MVIDTRGDPAAEFHHVDVLAAHAQVILKGLLRDMTSGNAHRHGAHRQVAPDSHEPDCQGGSSEAENPGRDVVSEGVVGILNIMTVDGEGQNTQLCVGRHGRSHGDGSRTFSGVEPLACGMSGVRSRISAMQSHEAVTVRSAQTPIASSAHHDGVRR